MFITGPDVIKTVTHEEVSKEELGGADGTTRLQERVAHLTAVGRRQDCAALIRGCSRSLPSNNLEDPPFGDRGRSADRDRSGASTGARSRRSEQALRHPPRDRRGGGRRRLPRGPRATSPATWSSAFARLGGRSVGVVANQPAVLAGCAGHRRVAQGGAVSCASATPSTLPLVTFEDVPGFLPGTSQQEHGGIIATAPSCSTRSPRPPCPRSP